MPDELARGGDAAIQDTYFAKQRHLALVERMGRFVGAGEVAHHQRDAMIFGADPRGHGGGLVDRNAKPVHAGIDLQRGAAAPVLRRREGVPFRQFEHVADHRASTQFRIGRRGRGHQPVEHVDRGVRRDLAHAACFA